VDVLAGRISSDAHSSLILFQDPDRSMLGASSAASCGDGAGRKCLLIASGQRPKDIVRMSQKLVDAPFDDFDGQDVSPGSGA
jgi:hypothetical protein